MTEVKAVYHSVCFVELWFDCCVDLLRVDGVTNT